MVAAVVTVIAHETDQGVPAQAEIVELPKDAADVEIHGGNGGEVPFEVFLAICHIGPGEPARPGVSRFLRARGKRTITVRLDYFLGMLSNQGVCGAV